MDCDALSGLIGSALAIRRQLSCRFCLYLDTHHMTAQAYRMLQSEPYCSLERSYTCTLREMKGASGTGMHQQTGVIAA